jgi:uncharacterized protein
MIATNKPASSVLLFLILAFAWSWTIWWGAVAAGLSFDQLLFRLLYPLGVFGPLVGAAWVVRNGSDRYRREFIRRIWDPQKIPARWWLALVAVAAGPLVLGTTVSVLTGTTAVVPDYSVGSVGVVVVFALVAGLAEEPGWRGAASDAWQAQSRPLWAALGIGGFWALWHLPLYFVEGSYQHGVGFGSARFWLISVALIQLGVLYLWLANGSGGSILIAILAHAGFNSVGELAPASTIRDVVALFLITATTIVVVMVTRGDLSFEPHANSRKSEGRGASR